MDLDLLVASFSNHIKDYVALNEIAAHEPIVPVQTSPWSCVTQIVLNGVLVRDRLEIAGGLSYQVQPASSQRSRYARHTRE